MVPFPGFSVDSLEAWRAALQIESFDLVAHSMGGYLATQVPSSSHHFFFSHCFTWPHRP